MTTSSSSPKKAAPSNPRWGLTTQIVVAMVLGSLLGLVLHSGLGYANLDSFENAPGWVLSLRAWLVDGVLDVGGSLFINALRLLVVPLVFCSLVCGMSVLGANLGTVGIRTVVFYLTTTAFAIALALLVASITRPGAGVGEAVSTSFQLRDSVPFTEILAGIIPSNPVMAMAEGNMLQIIVFSLLFGAALSQLGKKVEQVRIVMEQFNEVFINMMMFIVRFAPYGVFCLVGYVFTTKGASIFTSLLTYFLTVLVVLVLHAVLVYIPALKLFARVSPRVFFSKVRNLMLVAFSTSSSGATLPITLQTMTQNLGISRSIASFTAPLGATINMDGTSIMMGVATVTIAAIYSLPLTPADYILVLVTASLATIGTASVPGAGLIMLALVLQQVGLPAEGIGIVLAVDRLLDMARTSLNVCGDCVISTIVAHAEGELDRKTLENPRAMLSLKTY